ncbi:unnamed protein product [Parnassius mnemosyne]|uniref:Odorant receptor n=1 Tax=Parnassius mnemosyne TaxID=213953 RepID=A0AAV1LYU1_9NEOP
MLEFNNEFKISMVALRCIQAHPSIPRDKKWVAKFSFIIIASSVCFIFLIYSIMFHDIRDARYTEAIKNGSMSIVCLIITFKYVVLLRHQNSITNLIKIINEDYSTTDQFTHDEKQIILEYSKKGKNVCKFWLLSASSTGALFPLKALYFMARSYWQGDFKLVPMFDLTYPKIIDMYKDSINVFLLLFLLCLFFDLYASAMHIGFDPLVSIFLLHSCGQIDILSRRMEKVISATRNEKEMKKKLRDINKKLQAVHRFVSSVQSNFMELFEFNMKTTTFLLPFSAFQIIQSLRLLELNMEFICFFSSSILHFFMPCYYSNLLMDKGHSLREAIYSCGWENTPNIQIRKTVLFMLTRCNISLSISTIFYPINLGTFAEMCRQAYTIFSVMNAAWI